jgi:hypothetical protein
MLTQILIIQEMTVMHVKGNVERRWLEDNIIEVSVRAK